MRKLAAVLVIAIAMIMLVGTFKSIKRFAPSANNSPASTENAGPSLSFDRNNSHLILTKHARCRMECRHITQDEISEILHDGNINSNKSEPNNSRGPKYALEGFTHEHQHLRVIFAPERNSMVVVTCIDLDHEWECPSCN